MAESNAVGALERPEYGCSHAFACVRERPCGLDENTVRTAHTADKYRKRKRTGRAHVAFGNGTLSAACAAHIKAPMPDRCDEGYLRCLADAVAGILNMRIDENL